MSKIHTLFFTQGGGTVIYDNSIDNFIFIDPPKKPFDFEQFDIMPPKWGIAVIGTIEEDEETGEFTNFRPNS